VSWIEWALEPLRETLDGDRWDDLVSALSMVIGWESFIVLSDVRGLAPARAREVTRAAALAVLRSAVPPPS
jgi:hypothetical protein